MAQNSDPARLILLVIAIVILLPFLMMVIVWPMMGLWGGGHMWGDGMWAGFGGTGMFLLIWLVPIVVLIVGGFLLYRAVGQSVVDGRDAALEELRLAYARGDLSDEEFEQRRERLRPESKT